jgi:multidrug efflux system membrane fusion protein
MKPRVLFSLIAVAVLAVGGAYLLSDDLIGPVRAANHRGHGGPDQVVAVSTAVATKKDFPIRRRSIGVMESPATVVVRSRLDSQIMAQHVTDGQIVKKGDLLFTLDDRETKAQLAKDQAQLDKDLATQTRVEADLERTKQLLAKNAAARQQLDQATADSKAAAATVAGDRAAIETDQLKLSYAEIHAPISGRIGAVRVTPGNLVSANDMSGQGLATITQVKPIRVAFTVSEKDLALVRNAYWRKPPAPRAVVSVFTPGGTRPLASAPLNFIDPSIDSASGTLTAKATFPNEHYRLVPGEYVDVEIDLDKRPGAIMVPTIAVQTGQNGPFVFVVKPDKTVEIRPVTLIGSEGDETAIDSGLQAGDHVVIEGQLKLDKGTKVAETVTDSDLSASPPTGALENGAVDVEESSSQAEAANAK